MRLTAKINKDFNNQEGFAAIVVTLVMILVLSLITVGFAELMRSNQKAALDKQLSDQAYYAAETGINDAYQAYQAGYTTPVTSCSGPLSTTSDDSGYQYISGSNSSINSTTNVKITCLLMNPNPPNVKLNPVGNNDPQVVEMGGCSLNAGSCTSTKVEAINISWQDSSGNGLASAGSGCASLSSNAYWNKQNMLRIELVPLPLNGSDMSRSTLVGNAYTAFLCPDNKGNGNYTITSSDTGYKSNNGAILDSACTNAEVPPCNVTLNVSYFDDTTFLLIVRSVYSSPVNVTVSMTDASSNPLNIADAQLLVDSTGKAQNVLKRIQVRIPESSRYYFPNSVVEGTICKQLSVTSSSGTIVSSGDEACP